MPLLEVRALTKRFSGLAAVDNASFDVPAGEVTGYLGPNGSGKSTTLKMLTGLLEPTSGEIRFDGHSIHTRLAAYKQRLGYVPEEPHLYPHLTGLEYLEMIADLRSLPPGTARPRIHELLGLLSLAGDRHAPLSGYSKGMRQKVLLAAALLHNPDLILLDEPFSGLDIGTALVLRQLIEELARRGKAILFSSHELDIVERVSTRVVILHRGRVVANDPIALLRERMAAASLESVFSRLAIEHDPARTALAIADLVTAP